jgi:hypothetical protein
VAQLVEAPARGAGGAGSNPAERTFFLAALAQQAEASGSGPGGSGFESLERHHPNKEGWQNGIAPVSKTEARVTPAGVRIPHLPPETVFPAPSTTG